ncbi:MAG: FecR domain-containing protein [Spirochaetes bacterium]|nr:FecR domain-containing protein [Spirochaetota bacterium]
MKNIFRIIILTVILLSAADLFGAITVVSVKGTVAFKNGNAWAPLRANQTIQEGTKISTGANSYAVISLNKFNHRVEIKPLTMLQVFSKDNNVSSNSNINLKRGKIQVNVPKDKNVKTVFKVSTPVATSSVRGTIEEVSYGRSFGMKVRVIEGIIEAENRLGKKAIISGNLVFQQKVGHSKYMEILADVKDMSTVELYEEGVTADENDSSGSGTFAGNDDDSGFSGSDTQILEGQTEKGTKLIITTTGW